MFLLYCVGRASFWADLVSKQSYKIYKNEIKKTDKPDALGRLASSAVEWIDEGVRRLYELHGVCFMYQIGRFSWDGKVDGMD